jgi:hypothetical protein
MQYELHELGMCSAAQREVSCRSKRSLLIKALHRAHLGGKEVSRSLMTEFTDEV